MNTPVASGGLGPDDPAAFEVVNPDGRAPLLLVCDHASNRIPRALGNLGLAPAELERHIAWDIGAAALTRALARRLDAPAMLAGYSRLVVDLNRPAEAPAAIPEASDGTAVPANRALSRDAREQRLAALFRPYHSALAETLARVSVRHPAPILVAVHSFTPRMNGSDRPWHIGILWNRDGRVARRLIAALGAEPGLVVGDNLPYSGREIAYTLNTHAGAVGLAHVGLEVRQDLVAGAAGVAAWENRLVSALAGLLDNPEVRKIKRF